MIFLRGVKKRVLTLPAGDDSKDDRSRTVDGCEICDKELVHLWKRIWQRALSNPFTIFQDELLIASHVHHVRKNMYKT